jgi:primosomal protein N' (replication factor Y)
VAAFLHERGDRRGVEILGPSPAPLMKLKDQTRWQLLLKSPQHTVLHELCTAVLAEESRLCPHTVTMTLDIDPENMM